MVETLPVTPTGTTAGVPVEPLDLPERLEAPPSDIDVGTALGRVGVPNIDDVLGAGPSRAPDLGLISPEQQNTIIGQQREAAQTKLTADQQLSKAVTASMDQHQRDLEHFRNAENWAAGQIPGPWDAQQASDKFTTPFLEKFGSMAMVASMIGSAFSKQPLTTALAAGGAAMEAINKSDIQGYQRAYAAWKDNTELAVRRFEMEHQLFNDTKSLFDQDITKWTTQSQINAAKYKDDTALAFLRNGQSLEYFEYMDAKAKAAQNMQKAVQQGDIQNAKLDSWQAFTNELKNKHGPGSADPWDITRIQKARTLWDLEQQSNTLHGFNDDTKVLHAGLQSFMETGKDPDWAKLSNDIKFHTEAKLRLAEFSANARQALADANNKVRTEIAETLEAGRDWRASLSDDTKHWIEDQRADVRKEIVKQLEAGRDRRLATTEAGKTERLATTEAGKLERLNLSTAAKTEAQKLSNEAKRELAEYLEAGRETRFEQGLTSKEKQAELSAQTRKEIAGLNADTRKEIAEKVGADRLALANLRDASVEKRHRESMDARKEESNRRFQAMTQRTEYLTKPTMSEEDAKFLAERYVRTGDRMLLVGLSYRNPNYPMVQHFIKEEMEKQKISPEAMGNKIVEWEGRKAGQRVFGTQEARMGTASKELEVTIPLARKAIASVPRADFLPMNQLIQLAETASLSPEQAKLFVAFQGVANAYAALMNRGASISTDTARGRAAELLNTAFNEEAANAALDQMELEKNAALAAPEKMRETFRQRYGDQALQKQTQIDEVKTLNGVTYDKIGGKWYPRQ